jgi:SagB-type dehydrogenase family enzyme
MIGPLPMAGPAPVRLPRLRRGLARVTTSDGLLLEGGPSRQLLGGAAASSLVPRLLPLLDGKHNRPEISDALCLSEAHLGQALDLLDDRGLLEWVLPDGPVGFAAEHVATYMSRTMTVSGRCPSSDDLADQLATATVVLVAPRTLADPIAADLEETGVGTVRLCAAAEAARMLAQSVGRCVAAVFDDPADPDALETVAAAFRDLDLPVLRCAAATGHVDVGPVFWAPETACVPCFRRSQLLASPGPAPRGSIPAETAGMLPSLVTSALLGIVTRQPSAPAIRQLARTTLSSATTKVYEVAPDLECPTCLGGMPPQDPVAQEVLTYEWRMAGPPPSLEPDDVLTPAARDRLVALQRQRESFPTSPRHQLPGEPDITAPGQALDESVLAAILARAAGYRAVADPQSSRWAPSGGNMASVVVYLCTEADMFGLPGTIFRYDDIEHQLLSVRADQVPLAQLLGRTGLERERTDVAVILVGAVGRLRQKYGDFAWRLTHLDTGCAALQLHLVAANFGLGVTFASAWPAAISQLLELEPGREVVTAVAGLSADQAPREEGTLCH